MKFTAAWGRTMKQTTSKILKSAVNIPVWIVMRIILSMTESVPENPVLRLDKLITRETVIRISATQEERNHTSAELCNLGLFAKVKTIRSMAAVHTPPAKEASARNAMILGTQ